MSKSIGPWKLGTTLGEGGYSVVKLGTHEKTGDLVALKILKSEKLNMTKVKREIDAMKRIQHANVLQLKDYDLSAVYKKEKVVLCVLEYAPGGEIMEYLSFTGVFPEPHARAYFHQLMSGINSAHTLGVCHRDIKPENLLLDSNFQLKIADFGLSNSIKDGNLTTTCGSKGYMAPEMYLGSYDGTLIDVWACGVVLFIMVAGYPPYQELEDGWYKLIEAERYEDFWNEHKKYCDLSDNLIDLITNMLIVNPKNRITVKDILAHKWYLEEEILSESDLSKAGSQRKKIIDQNRQFELAEQKRSMTMDEDIDVRSLGSVMTMVLKMVDEQDHGKKGDDDDDDDDDDSVEGIRDSIDEGDDTKEAKEPPPLYCPVKMVFTKFDCSVKPQEVFEGLQDALKKLKIKFELPSVGYEIECTAVTMNGEIKFIVNVFSKSKDANQSIVEVQKRRGDSVSYRMLYARLRNEMETYVHTTKK